MSTANTWMYGANDGAPRPDEGWSQRTRYTAADFITLLWRERFLMAGICVAITALGVAYALTLKTTYTAYASVLVGLGQEYVYEPPAGDAARGAIPGTDSIMLTEVSILESGDLARRVIGRIGIPALYPDIATSGDGDTAAMAKAVRNFSRALETATAADAAIVELSFEHENPDMAARALNTLTEEYRVHRRQLLTAGASAITTERLRTQGELSSADTSVQAFLTVNNIGDFATEKATQAEILSQLEQQRYAAATALQEAQARLGNLNSQLLATPRELVLQRDENVAGQASLDELRLERRRLSANFLDGSDRIRNIDAEIADLERSLAGYEAGDTARRYGPNEVYQELATERGRVAAEVDAKRAQLSSITGQISQVTARQLELAELEPQYLALTRDQTLLQDNVRQFSQREQESLANRAISQSADNVRVVSAAAPPSEGSSNRKIVAVLAAMFGAFTALCVALLRIFLRPGLPTANAAGRTLDLPVLASARLKR